MATTIINPSPSNDSSNNNGIAFLIGIVVLVLFVIIFVIYGLPYLRGLSGTGGINVSIPVPDKIDVKVQQAK